MSASGDDPLTVDDDDLEVAFERAFSSPPSPLDTDDHELPPSQPPARPSAVRDTLQADPVGDEDVTALAREAILEARGQSSASIRLNQLEAELARRDEPLASFRAETRRVSKAPESVAPDAPKLEPLLAKGDHAAVVSLLGDKPGRLPPAQALLYAMSKKQLGDSDPELNFLAIRATARLLGLSDDSHTATIIAKRVLRRGPGEEKTKTDWPLRVLLMLATFIVGLALGWLVSP